MEEKINIEDLIIKNPKQLVLGCGSTKLKRMSLDGSDKFGSNVTRLDINEDHKPDIVWDLNNLPLPFNDNEFDEVHMYDVLEHLSTQGNYKEFFAFFTEMNRIMKNQAVFFAIVPHWSSMWAWGDPSHTRIINRGTITFLVQREYEQQVGISAMTDYRNIYKANFELVMAKETMVDGQPGQFGSFAFALMATK